MVHEHDLSFKTVFTSFSNFSPHNSAYSNLILHVHESSESIFLTTSFYDCYTYILIHEQHMDPRVFRF
jgi:hypothetical protein